MPPPLPPPQTGSLENRLPCSLLPDESLLMLWLWLPLTPVPRPLDVPPRSVPYHQNRSANLKFYSAEKKEEAAAVGAVGPASARGAWQGAMLPPGARRTAAMRDCACVRGY